MCKLNTCKLIYICLLLGLALSLVSCKNEQSGRLPQSKEMHDHEISCPENSHVEYAPWGEVGWVKACKVNHGKYVVWERGRLKIDGQFENGKKSGVWTYYDNSGNVQKTVEY